MKFDKWRKKCKNKSITKKKGGIDMATPQIKTKSTYNNGRKKTHSQFAGALKTHEKYHSHEFYNTILNLPVESMDSVKEEADKCLARILSKRNKK